jgi:hypothetical protein
MAREFNPWFLEIEKARDIEEVRWESLKATSI